MSEYQYVAFRAVDRPVEGPNLAYMERQSSRAVITPWSFTNEYHYGDFRGDAFEMLRRGYDLHLHFADFGIRKLLIRFPRLPDRSAWKPYFVKSGLTLVQDRNGDGCVLAIEPEDEPGHRDNPEEHETLIDRLIPLRAELLAGDLRPLYIAHLAVLTGSYYAPEEVCEPPVPVGLNELTPAQQALTEFYDLDDELIQAAAQESGNMPDTVRLRENLKRWLQKQDPSSKDAWLTAWMEDSHSEIRADILARFQKDGNFVKWPTTRPNRSIAELIASAGALRERALQEAAAEAARRRELRLKEMKRNPQKTLRETERLVAEQSRSSYHQAAELLAELREAVRDTARSGVAEEQAEKLRASYPRSNSLMAALRRKGLLSK